MCAAVDLNEIESMIRCCEHRRHLYEDTQEDLPFPFPRVSPCTESLARSLALPAFSPLSCRGIPRRPRISGPRRPVPTLPPLPARCNPPTIASPSRPGDFVYSCYVIGRADTPPPIVFAFRFNRLKPISLHTFCAYTREHTNAHAGYWFAI